MVKTTHVAAPTPVVIRAKNSSHGLAANPRPSAPSEVTIMPAATSSLRRPILSDQTPIGMRKSTCGIAYAAITTPTKDKVAPDDCIYTGKMGT